MEIKNITIVGLGALGIMYGNYFTERLPEKSVRIVADDKRIEKYKRQGVYCNGKPCFFHYISANEQGDPADLLLFTVKNYHLKDAIENARNQIGENTIILSALNGISSEGILEKAFGKEKVLYCVAQGMDALKEGNKLTYANMGQLVFGEKHNKTWSEKVKAVADLFDQIQFPYKVEEDMLKPLWGKFMLNVGANQSAAVFNAPYGKIHTPGKPRDTMLDAMKEVMEISQRAGVNLTQQDMKFYVGLIDSLHPKGKTSMLQDVDARRKTEVDTFAGKVIELGKKYNVSTPVNEFLYRKIKEIESSSQL